MADYPITSVARRIVYTGSAGVGPYAFSFPVIINTDIAVYKNDVLLTLTTDYTVTISGTTGQGSVTLVVAATGADRITIVGARAIERSTDFVTGGDFFANTLNTELDSEVIFVQQVAETAERSIKAPVTDPTTINMTLPINTARAGKSLAFDVDGNPIVGEPIGNYRGDWVSGTSYQIRDLVKDTTNDNIYYATVAHTSSGSLPIDTNADVGKWELIVDAEAAAASASAAASSASAASTSATNAAASASTATTQATNASTSATSAATSATNSSNSATSAATSATNAGNSATAAATSASAASTSATNAATSATNAANSATSASTSASTATTQATNASNSASAAATSATNASNSASTATTQASNASTSATNAATSATNAAASEAAAEAARDATLTAYDNFDDRYLGAKTSDPALDNDGNALITGALYFNSTSNIMKVYDGAVWVAAFASLSGALIAANNLSDLTSTSSARTNLGLSIGADVQAYDADIPTVSASQAEMEAGTETALRSMSPLRVKQAISALATIYGLFRKVDPTIVAWTKTGNFTATTSQILYIEVNGVVKTIASGATITMPGSATTGADYAIWAKTDGTLEATTNHTSPPTANARKVGGFHYAPGGNATAQSGGNTTAQINEYSFWDLKFRPVANDPRGMTLVAGGFWADIYLTNTDPDTNGTSKYNVTQGDGSSPPKISTLFGGNGTTTYGSLTWFESCEIASAYQKRLMTQREFMAMAYGTTEASSVGTDQVSTILNSAYTSKWGVIQAAGVLWSWGDDRGGPAAAASWNANTEGRGSEFNAPNAVILGGAWSVGSFSGSRCSDWSVSASVSGTSFGLRCACDHLLLD